MYRVGACETLLIFWLVIFIVELGFETPFNLWKICLFLFVLLVCCFFVVHPLGKLGKISCVTNVEEKSGNTPLV